MTAYLCQLLGRRGAPKLLKYWLIVDLNKINIYVKKNKLKTINLVRQREDIDELQAEMQKLGADVVLTEEETHHPKLSLFFLCRPLKDARPLLRTNIVIYFERSDLDRLICPSVRPYVI